MESLAEYPRVLDPQRGEGRSPTLGPLFGPTRGNTMKRKNIPCVHSYKKNPFKFLNSFKVGVGGLKSAKKFKKLFEPNRVKLSEIFLEILRGPLGVTEDDVRQLWFNEQYNKPNEYGYYDLDTQHIVVNPKIVTTALILLNLIFHELIHVVANKIDEKDSTAHGKKWKKCFQEEAEKFPGIEFEIDVDKW